MRVSSFCKVILCSLLFLLASNSSAQITRRLPEAHIAAAATPTPTPLPNLTITSLGEGSRVVWGGHFKGGNTFDINGSGFVSGTTYTVRFAVGPGVSGCTGPANGTNVSFQSTTKLRVRAPGMPCGSPSPAGPTFLVSVTGGGKTSNAANYTYTGYTGTRSGTQCVCARCNPRLESLPSVSYNTNVCPFDRSAPCGCTEQCRGTYGDVFNCTL